MATVLDVLLFGVMTLRILIAALIALLLLTGCTRPAPRPDAEPPVPPVASSEPEGPLPAEVAKADLPAPAELTEADLPVPAPLPEGLRRAELDANQPLESPGVYFMDVATGKLDAWRTPLETPQAGPTFSLWPSPDERWIAAVRKDEGYLIRRSDGVAFRYNSQRLYLTAGPGVILAIPKQPTAGDGSKCALLDEQMRLIATFALRDRCTTESQVVFSPDGKMLAITTPRGDEPVALVTVATGAVKWLGRFSAPDGLALSSVHLSALPQTGELMVEFQLTSAGAKRAWAPQASQIRRYTWQGDLRSDTRLPGWGPAISPDGKLLAYSQDLGLLGQAVVVQAPGADKPLFRVAGGVDPSWLAGSKELLLQSSQSYQLVSTTGALKPGPPTTGGPGYDPFVWLIPSPDDPNLYLTTTTYLTGASVVDQTGRIVRSATLSEPKGMQIAGAMWGPSASGFHFVAVQRGGKGYEGEIWNWIRPKVQRPPFPSEHPLQVELPDGDCLNLRAELGKAGKIIRCLPSGTRLDLFRSQRTWEVKDNEVWLQVETAQGERGWVAVSTYSLTYAD